MKPSNPLSFRPRPVIALVSVTYIIFAAALLWVGCTVPSAPRKDSPVAGVNLTEALVDLRHISAGFHPYNSRRNDDVRTWLLSRIDEILTANGVRHATVQSPDEGPSEELTGRGREAHDHGRKVDKVTPATADAVVFNDLQSNVSFSTVRITGPVLSTYFEGTNIIVYLRGREDPTGAWWETAGPYKGPNGVLVNAHYDSVSTGYGATDDGVGVTTVLQLLRYFSMENHRPTHGILFLLNNGEEDFLNGARAFAKHPTSKFPDRFLNLEGAGAGGRAALFRSTDTEVTRFYEGAKYPFATSTSADGFKAGLVKSETDYRVFYGDLDMRGLDIAFLEPRSKYHTTEDDVRHTGKDSIWHMLSAALPTMQGLVGTQLDPDTRTDAAWFDLFGATFAVMELHTLFALQVTLLVLAPVSILILVASLVRKDKFYLLSRYKWMGDEKARIGGMKGLFRAPIIFVISSACALAVAFLIMNFNFMIAMSSPWSVWACFMSVWLFATWFQSRFADYVRPTALHRVYSLLWLHLGVWVLAVIMVKFEVQGYSSGYPILFYQLGFWLATVLALLELFPLTRKTTFASEQLGISEEPVNESNDNDGEGDDQGEPTERTSLLRDQETSFRPRSRRTEATSTMSYFDDKPPHVYKYEQFWSEKLPSSLWILQFLLVSVPALLFLGPIVTFITSALTQTLSDGGGGGLYVSMALLSILVVAPTQPFMHRLTWHIPIFLLLVFAGTLSYNLVAFPFSGTNKLKFYFVQTVELDTGLNTVELTSADLRLLKAAAASLPSTEGQDVSFLADIPTFSLFNGGLYHARWSGIPPTVVQPSASRPHVPPELSYTHWLNVSAERVASDDASLNAARISLVGASTRSCKLTFDTPVKSYYVEGSETDNTPFSGPSGYGTSEIRLWRRTWETPWDVRVTWENGGDKDRGTDGWATCLWNEDEGQPDGGIGALGEFRRYAPVWAAVTKRGDGLVEGRKRFLV